MWLPKRARGIFRRTHLLSRRFCATWIRRHRAHELMAALSFMLRQSITKTATIISDFYSGITGRPYTVPSSFPVETTRSTRRRFPGTWLIQTQAPIRWVPVALTASNAQQGQMDASVEKKMVSQYGVWDSPISSAMASGSSMRFGGVAVDGEDRLLWVEGRPTEKGCEETITNHSSIVSHRAYFFHECQDAAHLPLPILCLFRCDEH